MEISELEKIGNLSVLNKAELEKLAKIRQPKYFANVVLNKELAPYQEKLINMGLNNSFTAFLFPRQCLAGDTLVLSKDNTIKKIRDIPEAFKTGIKETYRIITTLDNEIICTIDHKFYTKKGWKTLGEVINEGLQVYVQYKFIRNNNKYIAIDSLMDWQRIEKIKRYGYIETFDMEVIPEHYYIANGIKVHNSGKSFSCALLAVYKLLFGKNEKVFVIAPIRDQAKGDLFGTILELIESSDFLQKYLVPSATSIKKQQKGDSGFIKWMSASPNAKITGKTATLVIIDESQDIDDDKIERDIYPFAAHFGAPIIQVGTPRGRNHFYKIFGSDSGYTTYRIDHTEVPRITKEEALHKAGYQIGYIEQQEKIMSKEAFSSEYGTKFITDTNHAFRWKDINRCTYDLEQYNGGLPGVPYYCGLDFGKSPNHTVLSMLARTGNGYYATRAWYDWSNEKFINIVGIDRKTLKGEPDPDIESLYKISQRFKITHMYIDHTGMGDPISEMFTELNEFLAEQNKREIPFTNYDFSNKSKQELVDNMTVMMEKDKLKFSGYFATELRNYVKQEIEKGWKYKGDKGCHDDRVDSLMLAALSVRDYTNEIQRNKELEIMDPDMDIFSTLDDICDKPKITQLLRKNKFKEKKEEEEEFDLFAVNVEGD